MASYASLRSGSTSLQTSGKRLRIDGRGASGFVGTIPENTGRTTGDDVVNPRVDVQYLVPPYERTSWVQQIGDRAITFTESTMDDGDRKVKYNSRFAAHRDASFTNALDVMHVNAKIATDYIARINKKKEEFDAAEEEKFQAATAAHPYVKQTVQSFSQLEDPKETLRIIASQWKIGGVNFTPPLDAGENQVNSERKIGLYVRCDDIMRHYWGCGLKGGDYVFLVLTFIDTTSRQVSYRFNPMSCYVAGEFNVPLQKKYIPQFIAVKHHSKSLPLSKLSFKMEDEVYFGKEYLIGVCMLNPLYKFKNDDHAKGEPINDRSGPLQKGKALQVNLLIHG
jgi:hypothetical protein